MKDKISHIAKTLGLTPQAIRLYEEKGVLRCPRNEESGYRLLDRRHITTLLRCRLLRSYGFSVPEIADMLNELNEVDVLAQYRARRQSLRDEIAHFQALEARLAQLEQFTQEAVDNVGTCRLEISPAYYYLPFIDRTSTHQGLNSRVIQSWNNLYPFRIDTVSLEPSVVYTDERKYRVIATVEDAHLDMLSQEARQNLLYRPPQQSVIAWYLWNERQTQPLQRGIRFALDYIEAHSLRLCGDVTLTALLLLDRAGDCRSYFRAALPVAPQDESLC